MNQLNTLKSIFALTTFTVLGLTLSPNPAQSASLVDTTLDILLQTGCNLPKNPFVKPICPNRPNPILKPIQDLSLINSIQNVGGLSQLNPLLPNLTTNKGWRFLNVPSWRWFDPPTAYGFRYTMTDGSLFTHILDFPIEIDEDNLFTVSVGDTILGQFSPGESVDFVSLLGSGVAKFTITDINPLVDPENPSAFPIQLAFNTETASFDMEALTAPEIASVPEPTSVFALATFGIFGTSLLMKRKR